MLTQNRLPAHHPPAAPAAKPATAKTPRRSTTAQPTRGHQQTTGRNAANDPAYKPVTDAEVAALIVCSATRAQAHRATATFIAASRASGDWCATKPYDQQIDPHLIRLKRYLDFFHGRKSKSTGSRKASGWPITRDKFLIWAARDPLASSDSITLYLLVLEAARTATHHLFAPIMPQLSNRSLLLDPSVQAAVSSLDPNFAAKASASANQTGNSIARITSAPSTNPNSSRGQDNSQVNNLWDRFLKDLSASGPSLPPKPSFLPAKPPQCTVASSSERHTLSQVGSSEKMPLRGDLAKKIPDSSCTEDILCIGDHLPLAHQLRPDPAQDQNNNRGLAKPPKQARRLSESSEDPPLALPPAPPACRKKLKTDHLNHPHNPPAVDLSVEHDKRDELQLSQLRENVRRLEQQDQAGKQVQLALDNISGPQNTSFPDLLYRPYG
ncbi:hypothetical protein PTTG_06310 [Puccinia triticina 1-1 BBBD Race 1]|uniref:Uncharacterized protein n=1 Tax=Puccinia triticina (isolate 1-1 / race 1 (BBBD)) TaxID=630390 RepID=A0A180GU65_PUCT1|nr:hypothetical protein PTTG_06310 [Puccinia triticina 1-1 BBBD Race 1]WAR53636.1 hypothetical protein PtB15_3B144 [Puccinia triticina]